MSRVSFLWLVVLVALAGVGLPRAVAAQRPETRDTATLRRASWIACGNRG